MKALVYTAPNCIEVQQREIPEPAAKQVRLKILACGICGSDIVGYQGLSGRRTPPLVMGHEFCGVVDACGQDCTLGYKVGDRAVVQPKNFCGSCEQCKEGYTNVCEQNIPILGCIDLNGAFQEYLCVDEKLLCPMPDTMTELEGALIEPFAVAYGGCVKAGDLRGKRVIIVGAGTIGLMALSIVKTMGAKQIILSDLNPMRLDVARQMGADAVINPVGVSFAEEVARLTDGKMCDVAIEAVGVEGTVQQAMAALKLRGTAVWIGNNRKMVTLNMQEIVTRQLTVYGTFIYTHEQFREAMTFLNKNGIDLQRVVTQIIAIDQAPEIFAKLAKSQEKDLKVIVRF